MQAPKLLAQLAFVAAAATAFAQPVQAQVLTGTNFEVLYNDALFGPAVDLDGDGLTDTGFLGVNVALNGNRLTFSSAGEGSFWNAPFFDSSAEPLDPALGELPGEFFPSFVINTVGFNQPIKSITMSVEMNVYGEGADQAIMFGSVSTTYFAFPESGLEIAGPQGFFDLFNMGSSFAGTAADVVELPGTSGLTFAFMKFDQLAAFAGGALPTSFEVTSISYDIQPVPEPSTYAMLLAGLGMLGFMARRRTMHG